MAIESKFTTNEIQTICAENHHQIESRFYSWRTKIDAAKECFEVEKILENRIVEIRESYDQEEEAKQKTLEEEWIALVLAKDKNLHQRIDEENTQLKNAHLQQLYLTLEALGTFSFPDTKDAVLRRNLAKMFHQVGKYCTRNNIVTEKCNLNLQNFGLPKDQPMPPPAAPPPPPPPPMIPFCTPKNLHKTPKSRQSPKTQAAPKKMGDCSTLNEQRTPLQVLNQDLLRSIKHCRTVELKSTPLKRSPGGTPAKRQRRLSENDTSDLITIALRRKFRNASVQSPNENKSPNVKSPSLEFP
ncbi:mitochondrial fission regulator 1-like [Actinia tenebrosa]|uniref:Mitochondrial fission regulator 1-like n=1 Tax=Actinia tenebrosa TaxID=6105 RepID=A0A6P8I2M0_ACTTE|nr:mitochondrial fission regulator 1-like [Actinia tenebrosa]